MKILGIGTTVVDRVVVMDSFPDSDTKKEISHGWNQVGGPVPVALSTAAAFGAKTRLLSRWGNDPDGRYIGDTLSERNIDCEFTSTADDWQSGNAQVWLSQHDGSRTIAFCRGNFPALTAEDVTDELLRDCSILHLDGWASAAAIPAAIKMKEQGGKVVLDAGSVKPGLDRLLPHVDVLIASKLFRNAFDKTSPQNISATQTVDGLCELDPAVSASQKPTTETTPPDFSISVTEIKETTETRLLQLGPSTVITTKGPDGATLHDRDGARHIEGHSVDVVDSNGAGDIFSGAVLYGMTQEWPMRKTVEFANQIAAESCSRFGNQTSVIS